VLGREATSSHGADNRALVFGSQAKRDSFEHSLEDAFENLALLLKIGSLDSQSLGGERNVCFLQLRENREPFLFEPAAEELYRYLRKRVKVNQGRLNGLTKTNAEGY